jgi:hypothetical protein
MSFWQRTEHTEADELSRADIILAKKPARDAVAASSLIQVVIPRAAPRQNHQRNEDRRVVAGLTARLTAGAAQFEFPVANLSSNGLMVEGAPPLKISALVDVAIGGCDPVPMAVCWLRDGRTGLEFRAETAIVSESGLQDLIIDAIIKEHGRGGYAPAPLVGRERRATSTRHALMWLCTIHAGGGSAVGRIRNISRTGALIALGEGVNLAQGGEIIMALEKAGEFRGVVRWYSGQEIGVELKEEFPLALLANEPCVEVVDVAAEPEPALASREDALRVRYTGISDPTSAPKMDYRPLTLKELYETLYDGFDPARAR